MLSASAYSFRMKSRLAISLSWVAGYVNVVVLLVCGVVTSHATGNVTHFGERAIHGVSLDAWFFGFIVLCFFAGAVSSAFMTEGARRRGARSKYILPMAVQGLLLVGLALLIDYFKVTRPVTLVAGAPIANVDTHELYAWWIAGLASV